MINTKIKNSYNLLKLGFLTLVISVLFIGKVFAEGPTGVESPADGSDSAKQDILSCVPEQEKKPNGKMGNKVNCPSGDVSRNDINVSCLIAQTNANPCVDTMPVANKSKISRVPEDLCYRGDGWGNKRDHNGLDYAIGSGEDVLAAADGKVKFAGETCATSSMTGNGNHVFIEHQTAPQKSDEGAIVGSEHTSCFITSYVHLSKVTVSTGATVKRGQKIGEVGGTGCGYPATCPANKTSCSLSERIKDTSKDRIVQIEYPVHLHFEMKTCTGARLDPLCPNITDLCPTPVPAPENPYNPNACRDCEKNAAQCNRSYGNADMGAGWTGDSGGYPSTSGPTGKEAVAHDKTCTVQNYLGSFQTCVFCDIFKVLFNTATTIAAKSFAALTPAVASLVLIATAIWIAFTILKYITSFEVKEPRAMIKELLNKIFVVVFVLVLLQIGPKEFLGYTISPIFNTGMRLALMTSSVPVSCNDFDVITMAEGGGLPEEMGLNILCVVKTIQDSFLQIMALGMTSLCIATTTEAYFGISIFPHFGYLLTGLGLVIASFLIIVIYPWLLIDCVLKLCVSVCLIAPAIGAYPFDSTRKYISKVWETFLNSMFTFMFLSIILFILITMINQAIDGAGIKDLYEPDLNYKTILGKIGWWGVTFLKILFVILLGWAVLGEGSGLAGQFAGGMNVGNIGSSVGTLAMSGAKGIAKPVAKGGIKLGKAAGTAIGSTASEKINAAKINRQAKNLKSNKNATVDAKGNITHSYTNWRGKKVSRTLEVDANGNKSISKSKTDRRGNTTTTKNDKFMSVTEVTNKDGKLVQESSKMNAAGAKHLLNNDGTMNEVAINALMQNSLMDKETIQKVIANQMIKERFGESKQLNGVFTSRNVEMGVDEKGNATMSIVQQNLDGSTQKVDMTFGSKRVMIEVENISSKGHSSKVSSDGILVKNRTLQYNNDGTIKPKSLKEQYAFTDPYTRSIKSINSLGEFSNFIPEDEIMFGKDDIGKLTEQVAKYGHPTAAGVKK